MITSQKTNNPVNELLVAKYGIEGASIQRLIGYDSENFSVDSAKGRFILKVYPKKTESYEALEAETEILQEANALGIGQFPVPVAGTDGFISADGEGRLVRLLGFVEGSCLGEEEPTAELYRSFGKLLARFNKALQGFSSPVLEARALDWHLEHYRKNRKFLKHIPNPRNRNLVEYFFLQNEECVEPVLGELRRSVIHSDAHDLNVLVRDGAVTGLIDFGDVTYAPLINELAVALTFALFLERSGLEMARATIAGYNSILKLEEEEIGLLYYLIATRAAISVCHAAEAKIRKPDDPYVVISEEQAWKLLRKLVATNPLFYEDQFRHAAGMESKLTDTTAHDLERRHAHTSRALSIAFSKPIKIERAAFQYMFDSLGNSFLDCYNNIPQVGHCHPVVVRAGREAMARLNTNTRFLNDAYNEYAENLLSKFPANLTKVFFVNSGSAASDLAIRLAMAHTGNHAVMVMEHGYHGNTRLGIDISHYKYAGKGGGGRPGWVIEAPIADIYKGEHRGPNAGAKYAAEALKRADGVELAAFIAEPIVGCGGQIPLASGFLKQMYPAIRKNGGVAISDEVQTGFGRLGRHFWGFEMHGVEPDIVILGKPMGNGHPVAAVVTTDEIAASFETGMEFFSSFGGNPVSIAVAQAVLDVIEEEDLAENAEKVGAHLLSRFESVVGRFESAGDARGAGLFLGLELIRDGDPRSPNTELATDIKNRLRAEGILIGIDGPHENVIKIKPPLCFTRENADTLADAIENTLGETQDL